MALLTLSLPLPTSSSRSQLLSFFLDGGLQQNMVSLTLNLLCILSCRLVVPLLSLLRAGSVPLHLLFWQVLTRSGAALVFIAKTLLLFYFSWTKSTHSVFLGWELQTQSRIYFIPVMNTIHTLRVCYQGFIFHPSHASLCCHSDSKESRSRGHCLM